MPAIISFTRLLITALNMLQSIYCEYKSEIKDTGNALWSMFPIFTEVRTGYFEFDAGYCMSLIKFTGTVRTSPYDYPYIKTFANRF